MRKEKRNRLLARFLVWQYVVGGVVGLSIIPLADPWTNWNFLYLGCEMVILICSLRKIRRLEDLAAHWLEWSSEKCEI